MLYTVVRPSVAGGCNVRFPQIAEQYLAIMSCSCFINNPRVAAMGHDAQLGYGQSHAVHIW